MRKLLLSVSLSLTTIAASGQTTYLPLGAEEYHLLDRLETLSGELSNDFQSALKPIPRKGAVDFLLKQKRDGRYHSGGFSNTDFYNIDRALSISGEWSDTPDGDDGALPSRRPILKYFYQKQPDLVHVHTDDFFLVVNPVLYLQGIKERNQDGLKYINTRGAEIRGRLFNHIGFYTLLGDNQEKAVSYISDWERAHSAFPGTDYYRNTSGNGYDIFMARGYVDIGAFKDRLNITFGYDKQFSGDGMRSLLISDFAAPATFLRLRTKIWKLTYENLYLELMQDYVRGTDRILPHKYASLHQVSMNVTRWLNVGIFESTMYGGGDRFGVEYLVPVIFYNTAARALGANQKTALGFNFKAMALQKLQVYGQGYFDQVKLGELGKGSWANQFGAQLGLKYFNAFNLPNLDLQGEANVVRPFTYSASDGISNYTHYNQPLAHPYGAGFAEFIGVARYQPLNKLYLTAKAIYSMRSVDSNGTVNYGSDIFKLTDSRTQLDKYGLTPGEKVNGLYLNFNAAFELRPNIFLEAGATHLRRSYASGVQLPSSTFFYGGLRWNISRRENDYY